MRLKTIELIASIFAILVPVAIVIWLGARAVDTLDETVSRVNDIELQIADIITKQIEDNLINENVKILEKEVSWLKFHHHEVNDNETGRGHVD